jgi:drug/metabolite transporter (DMT)-like permease
MKQPIVYAIVAMVCFGLSDFIYKRAAAAAVRADHLLMAQAWFFCPLVILYALASHMLVLDPAALWGSLAGALIFIALYFFVRSLVAGSVSIVASIFRMNFIVTVLLAVALLGEPLTPLKLAGLVLALIATRLLAATGSSAGGTQDKTQGGSLIQVAIATLAMGASNFFHTMGLRHGAVPETLAVAQAACFMPLATAVVYFADRNLQPPPPAYKYGAAAAILLAGAVISLLRGIASGQASVLVPVAQMGFIVAAPLGIFVLGERVTIRKAIGLACALAALAVLATS